MLGSQNPSIIGGIIGVDYFKKTPMLKYRFLTHAHPSCYEDIIVNCLQSGFTYPIYCSVETAAVLPHLLRKSKSDFHVNEFLLRPLVRNVKYYFNDFTVILLDANHVAGAVIFVFDGLAQLPGPVLYAGHFRADSSFYLNLDTVAILKQYDFDAVILGLSYVEANTVEFPSQDRSINTVVEFIQTLPMNSFVYIITYPLTNFTVLQEIASRLKEPIRLYKLSKEIADILLPGNNFCEDDSEARIFTIDNESVLEMLRDLNTAEGSCEAEEVNENQDNAGNIYFLGMNVFLHEISKSALIINDPKVTYLDFADQCSFNELRDFLSILSYKRLFGIEKPLAINLSNKLMIWKTNSVAEGFDFLPSFLSNPPVGDYKEFISVEDDAKQKLVQRCDLFRSRNEVMDSDALNKIAEMTTPFTVDDFENAINIDDLANEVARLLMSEVSEATDAKNALESYDFSELVCALDSETRHKYIEACNSSQNQTDEASSQIDSFELNAVNKFSDIFVAAYSSLKKST